MPNSLVLLLLMHLLSLVRSFPLAFSNSRSKISTARLSLKMSAADTEKPALVRRTPLIKSATLTEKCSRPVYLKLDALQASGSFKDRGMTKLCTTLLEQGVNKVISSSGGNAGLAASTVALQLGMEVQVVVPETTKPLVIAKLEKMGATVTIHGVNWNAADELARKRVDQDPAASYISPYDNPLLWTGHSTVVDEILEDLSDPSCTIVASVGGGGLLCGVLEGLERNGAYSGAVIAAETEGAASFGKSWDKGELVRLESIDSIATSLGALEVTPVTMERAKAYAEKGGKFASAICTDAEAVDACWQFAADHRMLVEPACGAALAVAYSPRLLKSLPLVGPLVIEVCGGSGVNVELLKQWREQHPM